MKIKIVGKTNGLIGELNTSGIIDNKEIVQTTNLNEADIIVTEEVPTRQKLEKPTLLLCHAGTAGSVRAKTHHIKNSTELLTVLSPSAAVGYLSALAKEMREAA